MRPSLVGGSGGGGGGGSGGGFGFFLSWPGGVAGLAIIRSFLYDNQSLFCINLTCTFLVVVLTSTVVVVITTIRVLTALAVEWCHGVPKVGLAAANAGMAGLNRPTCGVVELDRRAIVVTPFTLTTDVFQTPAFLWSIFIGALVVNPAAIGESGSSKGIERRNPILQKIVGDSAHEIHRIRGTAR